MSLTIALNLSFGTTSCLSLVQQAGIGAEHGGPIGLSRATETRLQGKIPRGSREDVYGTPESAWLRTEIHVYKMRLPKTSQIATAMGLKAEYRYQSLSNIGRHWSFSSVRPERPYYNNLGIQLKQKAKPRIRSILGQP